MKIKRISQNAVKLFIAGKLLIEHSTEKPAFFIGRGDKNITMFRGNFHISEDIKEKTPLILTDITADADKGYLIFTTPNGTDEYTITISESNKIVKICGNCDNICFNRFWIRFVADKNEHVVGGGEQFSFLDLRGRNFPMWTQEQGVGRNKNTEITKMADQSDGGGGDYHTTYYPQPTFISSRYYFVHLENYQYSELDFRNENYHEIEVWDTSVILDIASGNSYQELCGVLADLLGHQIPLPDWSLDGMWLGVQGGTERVLECLDKCRNGGVKIPVVWIQDWEGRRITSFGKRLQWDWFWNEELYPNLDKVIKEDPSTVWMAYCNPYLVKGGRLYEVAKEKGYFVKHIDGTDYIYDFGEYDCGVVDLTMPDAFEWYKSVIIRNIIGLGFKGWMADFGEYLPDDCVCYGGSGSDLHNAWPTLWSKCNRQAIIDAGMEGDCIFFTRSGASGTQKYSTLMFTGDQFVDWTPDDGIPSAVTGMLSLGVSGFGLNTIDIGGYTSLFGFTRTEELLMRSLEMSAFLPVMRSHEGNRPDTNLQVYSNEKLISQAARMAVIHAELKPYIKHCIEINSTMGISVLRPLFFEAPDCDIAYDRNLFMFMLGDDMIIAPVFEEGENTRNVWLPEGQWIHVWSKRIYGGGNHTVDAPIGYPPVFYRPKSDFSDVFEKISACKQGE